MKITVNSVGPLLSGLGGEDKGAQPRHNGSAGDSGSSNVRLSTLSSRMREIETRLGESRIVDTARVSEIKQAMAEGRFRVNPELVADRLLDTVRALISSHKA